MQISNSRLRFINVMSLMKYFWLLFFVPFAAHAIDAPAPPELAARAYILIDAANGIKLAGSKEDAKVEPASLTKIMSAYLVFSAIREGKLKLDETLTPSDKAFHSEGSRMFLPQGKPARVDDLIRGMIVQSGNDATLTLAEHIGGTEENFVAQMNDLAKKLGMTETHFENSTGLPSKDHYSSARDMATIANALIRDFPEEYRTYYSQKEFTYNGITQPNRNRLLWLDPNVDGMKTGHTESAGYCLVASARRGERRLISVVTGTASDQARTIESQKLLNYGFQYFDTVKLYQANQTVKAVPIYRGSRNLLRLGFPRTFFLTLPRGTANKIQAQVITKQPILAPIHLGQAAGTLRIWADGKFVGDFSLLALDNVGVAGIFGRGWDNLKLFVMDLLK
jgi:serine-type D-Ala-D-Ala carboxypeptidase (penicillin-binding protein 5/6)